MSISNEFVFSFIIILFASTIWISSVSALPQQQTSLGVKITDPAKVRQLAIGRNLTLSGTSSYSATSNCGVFVIVDGARPYQKTIPITQAVGNNYSNWKYTLTPSYAGTIKEGTNRITAKLLCKADPVNLTKFYSINVTGTNKIIPKHPVTTRNNTVPATSNNLSYLFQPTPLINQLSFPADSAASSAYSDSGSSSGRHHHSTFTSATSSDSNRGRHHHSTFTSATSSAYSDSGSSSGRHHHSIYDKDHSYGKSSRHHRGYGGGDGGGYGGGDGGGYGGGDGGGYGGGDGGGYGGGDGGGYGGGDGGGYGGSWGW